MLIMDQMPLLEQELEKLRKYCAFQDRCHSEVRSKLLSIKVFGDELEEIITILISEGFLNEERFARSYCRGKFRMKKWGRHKIRQNLIAKKVSKYCIKKGMEEIDEDEYLSTLNATLLKAMDKYTSYSILVQKDKAIKYTNSRGYELPLIYNAIRALELDNNLN